MKKIIGILLMLVTVLILFSGCGVPQEDYDAVVAERDTAQTQVASLESDMAATQADLDQLEKQIAGVSSAWSSLKLTVELSSLLHENMLTWNRHELGEITSDEAFMESADQWGQISALLDAIGNEELDDNLRGGWFAEWGTKEYDESWSKAFTLLISLIDQNIEAIEAQLAE